MASVRVLNERPSTAAADPVALSGKILGEARTADADAGWTVLKGLAGSLPAVDPAAIEGDEARIAFWVNLYNALLLHCLCLRPLHGSLLRHLRLFDRVAYRVGAHSYSLNLIEHGVLRRNSRATLRIARPLRDDDPRMAALPSRLDPRIHFALNCGAVSCPPIQTYTQATLDEQLEMATRAYLQAETEVHEGRRCSVRLPRLMRLYRGDFGSRSAQLAFAAERLPGLEYCLHAAASKPRVRYGRFDWTVAAPTT